MTFWYYMVLTLLLQNVLFLSVCFLCVSSSCWNDLSTRPSTQAKVEINDEAFPMRYEVKFPTFFQGRNSTIGELLVMAEWQQSRCKLYQTQRSHANHFSVFFFFLHFSFFFLFERWWFVFLCCLYHWLLLLFICCLIVVCRILRIRNRRQEFPTIFYSGNIIEKYYGSFVFVWLCHHHRQMDGMSIKFMHCLVTANWCVEFQLWTSAKSGIGAFLPEKDVKRQWLPIKTYCATFEILIPFTKIYVFVFISLYFRYSFCYLKMSTPQKTGEWIFVFMR